MKAKKELGQNFLADHAIAQKLVEAGNVKKADTVLEIGGGLGVVSKILAEKAGRLITVELDADLIPSLAQTLKPFPNSQVIHGDGLAYLKNPDPEINKLTASLPYQITSPVLHALVDQRKQIRSAALLIQKEVAQRITAQAPHANYMSTFLQTFFDIEFAAKVDKTCFDPVPKVDGAIVSLSAINTYDADPKAFSKFLHHGFSQQRKMLNKRFPKEKLQKLGIDPALRPEALSIKDWLRLFAD